MRGLRKWPGGGEERVAQETGRRACTAGGTALLHEQHVLAGTMGSTRLNPTEHMLLLGLPKIYRHEGKIKHHSEKL